MGSSGAIRGDTMSGPKNNDSIINISNTNLEVN